MKDYVNWAILAPGSIANSMAKAMSETAKKDKRIRLYAVGSRNLSRAKEFADKWGFEKAYGSYEELISDKEVDAVYISNPHAFHYESAIACLKASKNVLCEKPAGCNIEQLEGMIKCAKENKVFFMEAMWSAFNPCLNALRKAIEGGKIGQLKHIVSRFCNRLPYDSNSRMWAPEQAGGALLDLGIYNIYVSSMLNGFSPVVKRASNVRMVKGVDAWNSVELTYENGVTAGFESACDMSAGTDTHDAIIFGTEGFIKVQNFFLAQKAEIHTFSHSWGNENEVTETIDCPFDVNGYEYEMVHTTECILKGQLESDVHTFEKSRELCKMMDTLRSDWGFKYPFEK